MSNTEDYDYQNSPGVIARNYMRKLVNNGYNRKTATINMSELETRLAGVCFYDDVKGKVEICISPDFDPNESISIWTDGSIVKEENAIAGIGFLGLNSRNQVVIIGSVSINSYEKGMDIYDVETMGVLIAIKISDDFIVDKIYCDNKAVVESIDSALKKKNYPINVNWIKGHSNNNCNNLADGLAKHGRYTAKRTNIITNEPMNRQYIPGMSNKRTGWKEIFHSDQETPLLTKEDCIEIIDSNHESIKHVYVWEREVSTNHKGVSSQYIIAHCDENYNLISVRRGLVNNINRESGRFMNSEYIMTRIPSPINMDCDMTLHISGFISSRYKRELYNTNIEKWNHKNFVNKLDNIGYQNIELESGLLNNDFTSIMNKSKTIAAATIPEKIQKTILNIKINKEIAQQIITTESEQPYYYTPQKN